MAGHFQNAQASCNKSDATFRKPHAKNSHGFPGCGVILMLVFVTYLFLHLCCVPIFFFFFFYLLSPSLSAAFSAVSETFMLPFIDALLHISLYLFIYLSLPFFPQSYPVF